MIEIRLKELLEAHGRSRYWLANETGVEYNTLMRIERAGPRNRIELRVLDEICRVLECQPGDILVRVDDNNAETKRKAKGK